jgi:hypothetical protein
MFVIVIAAIVLSSCFLFFMLICRHVFTRVQILSSSVPSCSTPAFRRVVACCLYMCLGAILDAQLFRFIVCV